MKKLITLLALAFCLNGKAQCTPPSAPILTAPTSVNNASCQGSPYALTVNSGTNVAVWYSGNTWLYIGSSYTPPASLAPGTYTYSVIDSIPIVNGCINAPPSANTMTLSLVVNPLPSAPALSGSNPVTACQGTPITLSVTPTGTVACQAPQWYVGSSYSYTGYHPTFSNNVVGTTVYSVYDSSNAGCFSSSLLTITVTVNPSPVVTYTLVADASPHTWDAYPTYSGGVPPYTYSWNWGDATPPSTTAYPSHVYASPGSYSICVTITDAFGCAATSCQYDAVSRLANNNPLSTMVYINVINGTMGIEQIANRNELNIYPNPNNGSFVIEPQNTLYNVRCTLYDVNGKAVLSQTINGKTTIDANNLNEGIYNISLQSNEGVVNKRLVIVR